MAILKQTGTNEFDPHAYEHAEMPGQKEVCINMLDKYWVGEWFLEMVESRFKSMLPYLIPQGDYTWRDLLGEEFFSDLNLPTHLASVCLRHLAAQPGSSLEVSSVGQCGPTYFRLRSQHGEH